MLFLSVFVSRRSQTHGCLFLISVDSGRKGLRHGVLPSLNMPQKSFETDRKERRHLDLKTVTVEEEPQVCYKSFNELCKRVKAQKCDGLWKTEVTDETVHLKKCVAPYVLPMYEVVIDISLGFSVAIFGWLLPNNHDIYKQNLRSMHNTTVSNLLKVIESAQICCGVENKEESLGLKHHVVPKQLDPSTMDEDEEQFSSREYLRSIDCSVLVNATKCIACEETENSVRSYLVRKDRKLTTPAKPKAPVSATNPHRVLLTLREYRIKNTQLEQQLEEMRSELEKSSVHVDNELEGDFLHIIEASYNNMTPFMKLFWEEQKKLSKTSKTGARFHPMIIRFCLSMSQKSATSYPGS